MTDHNKNNEPEKNVQAAPSLVSRRALLKHAGLAGAAALSVGPVGHAATASGAARVEQIPIREAFETLTAAESDTLDAIVERILPSDENGPGAREARAVHYIDRALSGFLVSARESYSLGLLAVEEYAQAQYGASYHSLSLVQQDGILQLLERNEMPGLAASGAAFFAMLRNHTIEGTFCDPYYGGNRDFIGWDMLGYPGVRMGATPEDVRSSELITPSHQSAYDLPPFTKRQASTRGGSRNGY